MFVRIFTVQNIPSRKRVYAWRNKIIVLRENTKKSQNIFTEKYIVVSQSICDLYTTHPGTSLYVLERNAVNEQHGEVLGEKVVCEEFYKRLE